VATSALHATLATPIAALRCPHAARTSTTCVHCRCEQELRARKSKTSATTIPPAAAAASSANGQQSGGAKRKPAKPPHAPPPAKKPRRSGATKARGAKSSRNERLRPQPDRPHLASGGDEMSDGELDKDLVRAARPARRLDAI